MNLLRFSSPLVQGALLIGLLAGCASSGGLPAPVENRSLDVARGKAPVFDASNPDRRTTSDTRMATPGGGAPVIAAQPPLAAAGSGSVDQPAAQEMAGTDSPDVESVPIQSGRIETSPIAGDEGAGSGQVITMSPAAAPAAPVVAGGPPAVDGDPVDDSGTGPAMPPMASREPTTEALPQAPEVAPAAPTVANSTRPFIWPAAGDVTQSFTDPKSMGIAIAGKAGDPVSAAADGRVIFSGLGPRGYGKLLIVEHDDDLLSVYGNNRALLVKEGQAVRQGQRIAELGSSGTDLPRLHFEIRRLGKPVDPISYLPPNSN